MSWSNAATRTSSNPAVCSLIINDLCCQAPTAVMMWFGCEHEHVNETPVCADHEHLARTIKWECERCQQGPGPHRCACPLIREQRV